MTVDLSGGMGANDLVSLSAVLRVCDLDMVVLKPQAPRLRVYSHASSDAIYCSGRVGFAFRGRFALPTDWCMVGYIHHTRSRSWCHGRPLESGVAFTVLPEGNSEFMLDADSYVSLMLLPLDALHRKYAALEPHKAAFPSKLLSLFRLLDAGVAGRLKSLYEQVRHDLEDGDLLRQTLVDAGDLLECHLLAGLSSSEDRPQISRGRQAHYMILQRAEQFIYENMRRDIYLNEICNVAGVSERALRYAFDDLLGISPNRYLSMLRLCTACRSLALSDSSRRSVKSVALSCGLWDLSRFADHYRQIFGELPRDTLMRSPTIDGLPSLAAF